MPANAIEKIEIITQPGAEFQLLWGAILNIITNKNAKNYLSALIPIVRVLRADDVRWRMNNSLLLS
jgi:hypothetical protein